ncbi:hypothetical protein AHF37_06534 [Paragonimus kellicotti]|nr:hypothetical protein AHF37_06534 [Paragonimus kellicotti]
MEALEQVDSDDRHLDISDRVDSAGWSAEIQADCARAVAEQSYSPYVGWEKIMCDWLIRIVKQAITMAVGDAKRKAELIASAFGQRIRGLVTVVESETTVQPVPESGEEATVERTKLSGWGPAIRSAQRRICVRLDVTCALDSFSR